MSPGKELQVAIDQFLPLLKAIHEHVAERKPSPEKWSAKEIVGHLIDSASNNHQRFVRAAFTADLVFPGYAQDDWVNLQQYRDRPWEDLIQLWYAFNSHLVWVMEKTDYKQLTMPRLKHNLHQIGWQTVSENEAATLEYFMRDYIGHLLHHLNQIIAETKNHA